MTATVRHLTHSTVALTGRAEAVAWLSGRLAWELRLRELERAGSVAIPAPAVRPLRRTA